MGRRAPDWSGAALPYLRGRVFRRGIAAAPCDLPGRPGTKRGVVAERRRPVVSRSRPRADAAGAGERPIALSRARADRISLEDRRGQTAPAPQPPGLFERPSPLRGDL